MKWWDWLNVGIPAVCLAVQGVMILRLPHYIRTGKWFR